MGLIANIDSNLVFDLDMFLTDEPSITSPSNIGIVLNGEVGFDLNGFSMRENIDFWIAVDGGCNHLQNYSITPDILIGDLDSISDNNFSGEIIKFDPIKDETDFQLTIEHVKKHFNTAKMHVVGISSEKRIEHLVGNIKLIEENMTYYTKYNKIFKIASGAKLYHEDNEHFSIFTNSRLNGLTITGSKYDISDKTITEGDVIGISNEFLNEHINIEYTSGEAIVFLSNEEGYYA